MKCAYCDKEGSLIIESHLSGFFCKAHAPLSNIFQIDIVKDWLKTNPEPPYSFNAVANWWYAEKEKRGIS